MPDESDKDTGVHKPSGFERAAAFVVAAAFIGIIAMVLLREAPLDDNRMKLAMVLMALLALALGVLLPGLLNLNYKGSGLSVRAAGGGAMFLVVLYFGLGDGALPGADGGGKDGAELDQSAVTEMIMNARRQLWGTEAGYQVMAQCTYTGATGVAWHQDAFTAEQMALQQCYANGGASGCCTVVSSIYE